jgi:formylglycine-generating enzyme required for sulfatase activity
VDTTELEGVTFSSARWYEVELRQVLFQTLQPADLATFLRQVEEKGGAAARAGLPTATAWAFFEPLQRSQLPPGATAEGAELLTLTMVEIPAGEFEMGTLESELERFDDEGPLQQVQLESFFMGQTPVTQVQWREVAQWEPSKMETWERELNPDPSRFRSGEDQESGDARLLEGEANTDQRPVEQVSWKDAMEFCNRLSQRTSRFYTLPSEAQWEYACRADTVTPFHFGETISSELANYNGNFAYGDGPKGEFRRQTTPVRYFPANGWGLQDMHGNVWEWFVDHLHYNYAGVRDDETAWLNSSASKDGSMRMRGGCWGSTPRNCRSASRSRRKRGLVGSGVGFRVVCLPQGPYLNS